MDTISVISFLRSFNIRSTKNGNTSGILSVPDSTAKDGGEDNSTNGKIAVEKNYSQLKENRERTSGMQSDIELSCERLATDDMMECAYKSIQHFMYQTSPMALQLGEALLGKYSYLSYVYGENLLQKDVRRKT